MKQVVIKKGEPLVVETSPPVAMPGFLLVDLRATCVSPGTEIAGITASGKSMVQRVLEQPDKAKLALQQMRKQGFAAVWQKAKTKFDREGLCGYSAAGMVLDLGVGVDGFSRGMRVAVAGAGHANHADIAAVPVNLTMAIPDGVRFDEASTVALGGIAMQGVRRAKVSLGERVAVIGCGPLGLIAVQLLVSAGCRVFASDLDEKRLAMAEAFGAECIGSPSGDDVVKRATHWSEGQGVDAVLIFAATSSGEPLSQAFQMCRRKGRVVLVGVAGSEYKRDDMYTKELDFVISTSYGPGRYDDDYELRGRDYPFGYVRWTEKRNMEAYLDLLAKKSVDVQPLIGVREPIENAPAAYDRLQSPERPLLAVLESSPEEEIPEIRVEGVSGSWTKVASGKPIGLAIVGGGAFVQATHAPILKELSDRLRVRWSCARSGTSARICANHFTGCESTTDYDQVLSDPSVHAVLIATRHDTHADLAIRALDAGKAVFLEKPMCLTQDECERLKAAVERSSAPFFVGYNRRYSPFADRVRDVVKDRIHPLLIHYTMNAGFLPETHWTQGPEGGGRLLGEACHIVDLLRSMIGCPVKQVVCSPLRGENAAASPTDNFSLTLEYEDGSVATLHYTGLGHRDVPKERMQVFFDEKAIVLNDYQSMDGFGVPGASLTFKQQDKGHQAEWGAFCDALTKGERFPIPWDELLETWQVTSQADRDCREGI